MQDHLRISLQSRSVTAARRSHLEPVFLLEMAFPFGAADQSIIVQNMNRLSDRWTSFRPSRWSFCRSEYDQANTSDQSTPGGKPGCCIPGNPGGGAGSVAGHSHANYVTGMQVQLAFGHVGFVPIVRAVRIPNTKAPSLQALLWRLGRTPPL
jgi:hypothetical protein